MYLDFRNNYGLLQKSESNQFTIVNILFGSTKPLTWTLGGGAVDVTDAAFPDSNVSFGTCLLWRGNRAK